MNENDFIPETTIGDTRSETVPSEDQWKNQQDEERIEQQRVRRDQEEKRLNEWRKKKQSRADTDSQQNNITQDTRDATSTFIYGTSVETKQFEKHFSEFLKTFVDLENENIDQDHSTYEFEFHRLHFLYDGGVESSIFDLNFVPTLNIRGTHLHSFSPSLYKQIVTFPQELIPTMDVQTTIFYKSLFPATRVNRIQVRVYDLRETILLRDLGPDNVNQLITIRGMVTRVSEVIPDLRAGVFRCDRCREETQVNIQRGFIEEPRGCPSCGTTGSMHMIHNRSKFADKQLIKLQETPEVIPEGETPHTVSLSAFDSLVDIVKPGDRVDVTGIFRAVSSRVSNRETKMRNLFQTYIDVIHCKKSGNRISSNNEAHYQSSQSNDYLNPYSSRISRPMDINAEESDIGEYSLEPEDIEKIRALSRDPKIYEKLVNSIAPGIFEMEDVKKGILCQLFGGTNKILSNGKIRGELHVLLVGDPGVSKSQLLIHVNKIAPRGIYTSGKGSSAVGLTAYISKDLDTGEYVLESGALVLSDLGVCCIDEFDKMADHTRSILHEVMEQQTVSVAKAGIICSLNARTSILAAANPVESRYNPNLTIVQNIRLMPTLLSRFDLIYILRDISDDERDRRLAEHLISFYQEDSEEIEETAIPMKLLTKYISYAKRNIRPTISDAASDKMKYAYLHLRQIGTDKSKISATTRQLESLIRLSEALAKMRLSSIVEAKDVDEALRLIQSAFRENLHDAEIAEEQVEQVVGQDEDLNVDEEEFDSDLF